MAISGDGAASYESGGAGGKFRKRPFRRPPITPYDRPLSSIRNPNSKGWLSKIVDPASKLVMASAQFFFSSVFRKRLAPPPQQAPHPKSGANQEQGDKFQKDIPNNYMEAGNTSSYQVGSPKKSSDGNPVFDLEQLLKQKTFTRSESDSLMALLRSRTVELPVGVDDNNEKTLSQPSFGLEIKMEKSQGIMSSPFVNSKGIQENVASPAELLIANTGSRPLKVSPSVLGLDNQGLSEDSTLTNNQSLTLTTRSPTLLSNSSGCNEVRDNGFISTRYRGRSAIYSMARSPYFGVHPTTRKDLKRISATLDDEMGSSGITRRVRRKPNLSSQGNYGKGVASSQHHVSSPQSLLSNKSECETSEAVVQNGHSVRFPSKSSEMGTKTTHHLEKLSPKQKSSELRLVDSSEKPSPTKLTLTMLSGQALRSLEHVDSSKFMRSFQNNHNLEDTVKDTVLENGPQILAAPHDTVASRIHADTAADSVKDALHNVTGSDNNDLIPEAQPTQNGRTFQMSAFEDSVELDDEIGSDGPSFSLAVDKREKVEERQKTEKSMVEIKDVPTKAFEVDKVTEKSESNEKNNLETGGRAVILEEKSGFTFATPSVTTTPLETARHTESNSVPEKSLPAQAPNDSRPVFSFNPKVNIVPSSTFLLPSVVNESVDAKSTTPLVPNPETPNSLENGSSGTADSQPRITALGEDKNYRSDNNSTQNGGDTKGNLEPISTSSSTSKVFSFGAPNNNSVLNISSPSSSASIFSSTYPLLPFTSSANTPTLTSTTVTAAEVPSVPAPLGSDVRSDKTADSNFNTESKATFGNQNPLPFSSESFSRSTPTGSSVANPMLDNQSQAPLFGTGSGSLISSTQPPSSSAITPSTSIKPLLSSSTSAANLFTSSSSFGLTSSTCASETVSVNTASCFSSTTFGSSLQQDNKPPVNHNPFTSPNLSTGFAFGAPPPSSTATNTAPMVFGSTPSPSPGPVFSFGSATLSTSTTTTFTPLSSNQPPAFGSTSVFNTSPTNKDQMSMEDSMAEDPVQTSAPGFGQQPVFSPPSGFMLGSTAPLPGNPFQFGGQPAPQNPSPLPGNPFQFGGQAAPQIPSPLPFQASGSLEFNAAGSFSLGSGGGEKSSRRTVKVSKIRNRKKP